MSVRSPVDAMALERDYMPAYWPGVSVPDAVQRWNDKSDAFRARSTFVPDLAYGDSERERIDLYLPDAADPPLLVFFHGGYWRFPGLTKINNSFCVERIVAAGAAVAMVEYDLCPQVTMDTIVDQARKACAWLYRDSGEHGCDPARLHVSGHSAGGHLTAMLAATDWKAHGDDLPADLVKSAIPISGLFDLEPFLRLQMNGDLRLDEASARRNSPMWMTPPWPMPVTVVVGGGESEAFRQQSRDFERQWAEHAGSIAGLSVPGHDHFKVIEAMPKERNPLTAVLMKHLGVGVFD